MSQNLHVANFSNVNGHLSFEKGDKDGNRDRGYDTKPADAEEFKEIIVGLLALPR